MIKLYNYFRSSASYRVRIALHWKELKFEYIPVHLVKDGGQQNGAEYRRVNPMGHVPALDHDGFVVAESVAIIQYLDDLYPEKRLVPVDPRAKAGVLQLCEMFNSGIQPLQNLKVIKWLESELHAPKAESDRFVRHWMEAGFASVEKVLERTSGTYSVGNEVSAVDCFLVPQCFACRRFGVDVDAYPHLARVNANALRIGAFQRAHPEKQPDYQA
jgi:maleylacetoacetate isomerase